MRVLLLATGADVAGQLHALKVAINHEHPDWHVDQVTRTIRWGYPRQHAFSPQLVANLWKRADVVHLALGLAGYERFGRRRVVVHYEGSEYRSPERRTAADKAARTAGAVQVAATLDLLGSPGVSWLPAVVDINRLRAIREAEYQPSETIRIAHSPTNPEIKGTADLIAAVERLKKAGCPVELDVITGVPWAESLRRKARADVFFDQLTLGYGLSAVEAWAMGLPVIAGASFQDTLARMAETFGVLPFLRADHLTLPAMLVLMLDPEVRRLWSMIGTEHVERFHSEPAIMARLEKVYEQAMG